MRVPLGWLRELCPTDLAPEALGDLLALKGSAPRVPRAAVGGARGRGGRPGARGPRSSRFGEALRGVGRRGRGRRRSWSVCGTWPPATWCRGRSRGPASPGTTNPSGSGGSAARHRTACWPHPARLALSQEHESGILLLEEGSEVGADVKTALGLDDVVLDLEIESNRPDLLSIAGIAREVAGATGVPLVLPGRLRAGGDRGERHGRHRRESRIPTGAPATSRVIRGAAAGTNPHPGPGAADGVRRPTDLPDRGRDELRDARARPAAPRVRPPCARRTRDRRAAVGRGRAPDHAGRRRARARGRPPDLRPRGPVAIAGVMGARPPRWARHARRPAGERVLRAADRAAHLAAAPAPDRGVRAVLARDRPRRGRSRGRPGRPADRGVGRRRGPPRRDRRGRRAAAAAARAAPEPRRGACSATR